MFNFKDEVELLLENNGCIQVEDIDQLSFQITQLFNNSETIKSLGDNAKNSLNNKTDILENYLSLL